MAKLPFKNLIFLMQKRLSVSAPTTPVAASSPLPSPSFTTEYLVNSCGLTLKSAISASQTIHLNEKKIQRYDSVLNLLTSLGFDHTHIARIVKAHPDILTKYKVDDNLKPKFELLALQGFTGPHLHSLIVENPFILKRSLTAHINPSFDYLMSLLGTKDRVLLAVKRSPRLLTNDLKATLQPNVDLLVKEGVALHVIADFLVGHPQLMQHRVGRSVSALKAVKDRLAMDPSAPMFLLTVTRISANGVSLWEKKMQMLQSFGLSPEQALSIYRRNPHGFSCSYEKLRTKMEFYLVTAGLKLDSIISYPTLLNYAIDTRSRPRHNVLKLLLSMKLLKEDAKLAHLYTISEEKFLKKYVADHLRQVPNLLEMYSNDKVKEGI